MKQTIIDLKNKIVALKFARFFLSGGFSFLIDTGILIIVKTIVFQGIDYKILETVSVAKLISGTIGIAVMFTLSRVWVFSDTSKNSGLAKVSAKYLSVTVFNLILGSILFTLFSGIISTVLGDDYNLHITLYITFANLMTEATKMIVSFFAYKYFVFR